MLNPMSWRIMSWHIFMFGGFGEIIPPNYEKTVLTRSRRVTPK